MGNGSTKLPFSADITGLAPGTTYSYKLVGQNSSGTNESVTKQFTTLNAAGGSGHARF